MDDGPGPFDATDARDATMPPASSANDLNPASEGSDATILNSVETDDVEFNERRQSGLSNASFESDRRPLSRSASDFHESARNSYGSAADDSRHSLGGGSEQAGGRVSAGGSSSHHSSHHDQDDDVFSSSHSARSSMGSNLEADHLLKRSHSDVAARRMTGGSHISDMQPYDPDEEFVPAVRETPRPPFRSPSSVKAMQMNSPPPSVIGSARSARRAGRSSISRIGSPAISTQYSPKKTPPRFKRNTPPLVLLHVTLLPLRWPWADLMDNARPSELSEAGKTLREAWKQLQTRVGDTVSDRGILLPHPQNDFEILEERLLEAMELPLLRRARILECGHYLGPANETSLNDDGELVSDDEDFDEKPPVDKDQRHWCATCQSDIRYDSLGEGKVFRTKVYASNGLMKAGAWDACWKEMERVDVELEPIVDPSVLDELERIAATQEREAIEAEIAASTHMGGADDDDDEEGAEHDSFSHDDTFDRPLDNEESRNLYEERMREIYGQPDNDAPAAATAEAEHVEPEEPPVQEPAAPTTTSPKSWPPTSPSPSTTAEVPGRAAWAAELFKYGFRDVLQLIVFILCVLLLQYFGIGFDRKGNDAAALTRVSAPAAEVAAVLPQVTHTAAAAAAAVNEVSVEEVFAEKVSVNDATVENIFLDTLSVDNVSTAIASAEAISAGSSTAVHGRLPSAAARSEPDDAYGESYAACTSALEAAQALLAVASATATVTVTETVSVSMAATETQAAADEQPEAPLTTGVSGADESVEEEDDKAVESSTLEAEEKSEL